MRKNNDLNVGTVVYNERLAYLLRNTTLNVELDAEGNLVVVGDRVDQLTAALGDGNVINTMLLSKDSDRLRAVEGDDGKLYFIMRTTSGGWTSDYEETFQGVQDRPIKAMSRFEGLPIYRFEVAINETVGKLEANSRKAGMDVDVDADFTFGFERDSMVGAVERFIDTSGMNVGDVMYYPIFVGSADHFTYGGTMSDEVGIVLLEIHKVLELSDLSLDIYTSPGQNDPEHLTLADAVEGDGYQTSETLPWFNPEGGRGDVIPVYNYTEIGRASCRERVCLSV